MKATLILVILLPICTQAQTYIKVRPGDRLIFKADTSTMYIEIVPDMVRDTVFVNGDSALVSRIDHIIDQIPRMEVADSNTWVNLATLVNLVSQIKTLLQAEGNDAVAVSFTTQAQYLAFLNRVPRPKVVSSFRLSATSWLVFHRP